MSGHKPIVILDMDHTICNSYWRDGMIGVASWDEYHAESMKDKPNEDLISLIDALNCTQLYDLVVVTARPEKFRSITMAWLGANNVTVDALLMRPNDDRSPAHDLKLQIMRQYYGDDWASLVMLAIDDSEQVVSAYRAMKIATLHYTGVR